MQSTNQQVWFPKCSSFTVFSFYFLAALRTCGILVPWPRIESVSPALEAWNFNHQTTGEVSSLPFRLWPPITFMRITFRAKVEEKSMILRKSHIDWNLNVYDTKYFSTPFFLWIILQATKFCIYFFISLNINFICYGSLHKKMKIWKKKTTYFYTGVFFFFFLVWFLKKFFFNWNIVDLHFVLVSIVQPNDSEIYIYI